METFGQRQKRGLQTLKGCVDSVAILTFVLLFSRVLCAQGGPQQPGEKARANSPVDLSGVWNDNMPGSSFAGYSFTAEIPAMTPWGGSRYEAAKPSYGPRAVEASTDPVNPTTGKDVGCFPPGVPRIYIQPFPFEIMQLPGRVIELFEFDHYVRQIWTDGRQHPEDPDPTWMGDSIGHWEGDTLVVDTLGFNDKTWLDRGGLPHSEQLHVTERIRRPSHDALEIHFTIEDPKTYIKPWVGVRIYKLQPNWNIKEFICLDNIAYNDEFIKVQEAGAPKPAAKQPSANPPGKTTDK
jgi:hypothetical protein